MAFQSSVYRDGQWVTETVNLEDALRVSAAPKPTAAPRPKPPVCGLLSRTVIESPVVHWALSVRLRSHSHNDVAFVGVSPLYFSRLHRSNLLVILCSSLETLALGNLVPVPVPRLLSTILPLSLGRITKVVVGLNQYHDGNILQLLR